MIPSVWARIAFELPFPEKSSLRVIKKKKKKKEKKRGETVKAVLITRTVHHN